MTTENTDMPKKPRLTAATKKRIAALKSEEAVLVAAEKSILAAITRARIERLERGLPEDDASDAPVTCPSCEAPHPDPNFSTLKCVECDHVWQTAKGEESKPVTWNDVVEASKEAESNRVTREQTFDKILVDLTPEERAELGAEHVAADAELADLTEEKKEAVADFKARIAKVESRKREIAEAITRKKKWQAPGSDGWLCEETFATNTRRYLDPKTGRVMCTEAMTGADRQLALPKVSDAAAEKAAQLSLGEVDPTATTDPEALLKAAAEGEIDPADEPLDNDGSSDDLGDDEDEDSDDGEDDE